jgi:hypothetical protein
MLPSLAQYYRNERSSLRHSLRTINLCPYKEGCPSCVGPCPETGRQAKQVAQEILWGLSRLTPGEARVWVRQHARFPSEEPRSDSSFALLSFQSRNRARSVFDGLPRPRPSPLPPGAPEPRRPPPTIIEDVSDTTESADWNQTVRMFKLGRNYGRFYQRVGTSLETPVHLALTPSEEIMKKLILMPLVVCLVACAIWPCGEDTTPARKAKIQTDLVPPAVAQKLVAWLTDVDAWILGLDAGSQILKNTEDTADSIFINGNFARLLVASHRIAGTETYLREALRWGESFYHQQRLAMTSKIDEAGYWVDLSRNPRGNIYFGDGGTAASALAVVLGYAEPKKKNLYLGALERYARFVIDGCLIDPQGLDREASAGWVIRQGEDRGALGCGYYLGHLSLKPYTISTATTGGGFFSALFALTGSAEYREIARGAVTWLLKIRKTDGEIPYILDGETSQDWPLDTLTYCTEAFVPAWIYLKDEKTMPLLRSGIKPTIDWFLALQNADGSWGEMQSPDQQRSPRAVTLLAWYYRNVEKDPKIKEAILKYCRFLLDPDKSAAYGIKKLVRTTGFAGLTVAEILLPGSTY